MEWYLGSEVDDLVVPRNQESLERISLPDSWSQWGITAFGAGSDHPKKNLFRGHDGKSYTGAINLNNSDQEREDHANNSSTMCQGLYNGSILWPHDEEQARIDRMDDIFLYKLNFWDYDT